jgi:ADP-ribose pyrophosphatase
MSSLTETTLDSENIFDGTLLHVRRDTVRLPNGKTSRREWIRHPGAAVIVPVLNNGNLLLERQYRYPLRRELLEFPAGKIDPGEDVLTGAKRELQEETGLVAETWQKLGAVFVAPGYSDELIHCFVAQTMSVQPTTCDDDEFIECVEMSSEELAQAIADGRVNDAKTVCAFYLWQMKK